HHAGLAQKQRELIEDAFRDGKIKIICSTPTLAAGVDLPAFRTILKSLRRYSGRGMAWIPVLEYLQMSGRAGRPGKEEYGESIAIAASEGEKDELCERYVQGEPEPIYSKLAVEPVLRTYVLSLIASNVVNDFDSLIDFFSHTFWAYQYQDMEQLSAIIEKMVALLEEYEFITVSGSSSSPSAPSESAGFVSAEELIAPQRRRLRATILGKRVAELYLDPLTAYELVCALRKATLHTAVIHPFAFLQAISQTLEMTPPLSVKAKEWELLQEKLAQYDAYLLTQEPTIYDPSYERFLSSVKLALTFEDWTNEKDEEYLLETYAITPGELHVKLNLADWLIYATQEIARILQFHALIKDLMKLRVRLKYGVQEELLTLLRLKGVGRVRARRLYTNKIKTLKDVREASLMTLSQILGKGIAEQVKKQVE
ncbi:ski2-like helicase, partial [Candidatus Woesearchaeota archaeon CG_4_10_14_0_8_um_filter_47_5]